MAKRLLSGLVFWGILGITLFFSEQAFPSPFEQDSICSQTAKAVFSACQLDATRSYWLSAAACLNKDDDEGQKDCSIEASDTLSSALENCSSQFEARLNACDFLNEDIYSPKINPDDFSPDITNSYFPLTPGTTYVYQGIDEEGKPFEDGVEVTDKTTEIMGTLCRVVKDVVSMDGEVLEETYDFYVQDKDGNVWYFGEDSREYENGWISSIAGAWFSGVKGAQSGIIMKANLSPGQIYRQEYQPGNAEDMAAVMSSGETVTVPHGTYTNCIKTIDWSPFEPDIIEYKYYAPGIGFIKSEANTGETVELVSISTK